MEKVMQLKYNGGRRGCSGQGIMVHNLILHVLHVYTCTCVHVHVHLYMVHVCTNGVKYRLQITYMEGSSSLFACTCIIIHDICTTFHVHGDW